MSSIEPNIDLQTKLGEQSTIGKRFTLDDIASYTKSSTLSKIYKNITFIFQRKGILTEGKVKELLGSLQPRVLSTINDAAKSILSNGDKVLHPKETIGSFKSLSEVKDNFLKPSDPQNINSVIDFKVALLGYTISKNFPKLEAVQKYYSLDDNQVGFNSEAIMKEVCQEMIKEKLENPKFTDKPVLEKLKTIWENPDDQYIMTEMKKHKEANLNSKIEYESEKIKEYNNSITELEKELKSKTEALDPLKKGLDGLNAQPETNREEIEILAPIIKKDEEEIKVLENQIATIKKNLEYSQDEIKAFEVQLTIVATSSTLESSFPTELNEEGAKAKYYALLEKKFGGEIFLPLISSIPATKLNATIKSEQWMTTQEFDRTKDTYAVVKGIISSDFKSNVEYELPNDKMALSSAYPIKNGQRENDPIADDMRLKRYYVKDNTQVILFSGADGSGVGVTAKNAAIIANKKYIESYENDLSKSGSKTVRSLANTAINSLQNMQKDLSINNPNGYTTHIGLAAVKEDKKIEGVISSIGDMKIFLKKKDGTVEDLTKNNRGGFGGAKDPGGQLGGSAGFPNMDIRNLKLIHFTAEEGDVLLPMSDGIHDNLTAQEIEESIRDLDPQTEDLAKALVTKVLTMKEKKKPDHLSAAQIVL